MFRSKLMLFVTLVAVVVTAFAAVVPAKAAPAAQNSIVDVALAVNGQTGLFDTLIAALVAADPAVIQTLSSKGQYTVFAPTDDAFAKLGLDASNIGTLDTATLTSILLYHVAPGSRTAEDVVSSSRIRTLSKGFLTVVVNSSGAFVDGNSSDPSRIILTDVAASNGVIHVIDTVLLP